MRQSASKLFVFCSACPIILWGVSGIVFANRNNDRWAQNRSGGFWRIALRPRCLILLLHLCSQLATVCALVLLSSFAETTFLWVFLFFSTCDSTWNDRGGRHKTQGRASFALLPRRRWECAICLFKCPAGLTTGACPHLLSLSQDCPDNTSTPTRPSPFAGAEVCKPSPRLEPECSQLRDRNRSNLVYRGDKIKKLGVHAGMLTNIHVR